MSAESEGTTVKNIEFGYWLDRWRRRRMEAAELLAGAEKPLVVVCGHAPFADSVDQKYCRSGLPVEFELFDPRYWVLEPYQQPWEISVYANQALAGIVAGEKSNSQVCFSGGVTRPDRTRWSEAQTSRLTAKWLVAELRAVGQTIRLAEERVLLGLRAADSETNLVDALRNYRYQLNCWPDRVLVVSWGFKEERFVNQHMPAVGRIFGLNGEIWRFWGGR